MSREVEMATAVHLQNAKRLDDARLTVELRKQQLTNIAVTEPPRATAGSRSTKQVAMVAVLGAVVGLALGVATALALDFFNWALRTPDDVEFYLGVPTLAAIPAVTASRSLPYPAPTLEERDMDTPVRNERG
jgi:capsular polysaccharide biosynthesis protein